MASLAAEYGTVLVFDLHQLGPSVHEMATNREFDFDARLTVADVTGDYDVPHLLVALDDGDVCVEQRD